MPSATQALFRSGMARDVEILPQSTVPAVPALNRVPCARNRVMGMAPLFYSFVSYEPPTAAGQKFSDKMSQFTELELLPRKIQLAESPA